MLDVTVREALRGARRSIRWCGQPLLRMPGDSYAFNSHLADTLKIAKSWLDQVVKRDRAHPAGGTQTCEAQADDIGSGAVEDFNAAAVQVQHA
jgi:hypothetical protein